MKNRVVFTILFSTFEDSKNIFGVAVVTDSAALVKKWVPAAILHVSLPTLDKTLIRHRKSLVVARGALGWEWQFDPVRRFALLEVRDRETSERAQGSHVIDQFRLALPPPNGGG